MVPPDRRRRQVNMKWKSKVNEAKKKLKPGQKQLAELTGSIKDAAGG